MKLVISLVALTVMSPSSWAQFSCTGCTATAGTPLFDNPPTGVQINWQAGYSSVSKENGKCASNPEETDCVQRSPCQFFMKLEVSGVDPFLDAIFWKEKHEYSGPPPEEGEETWIEEDVGQTGGGPLSYRPTFSCGHNGEVRVSVSQNPSFAEFSFTTQCTPCEGSSVGG